MVVEFPKEDFEMAVLRSLADIHGILRSMVEFQERMGEALEMLAGEMGYKFTIKKDASA